MRSVGRHIDGLASFGHEVLVMESYLYLTHKNGEHLFEVVTMGMGTAAGRYEHVDECVLSSGVVTGKQDRVRISDDAEVREAVVLIRSCDRDVPLRVVGRY